MMPFKLALLFVLISGQLFAQEQMALRVNEKGIMKILRLAIQYNTASKESRNVVIPGNIYKFTLPKEELASHPLIPIVNEISDLNMHRDLDFYFSSSDINVSGDVDANSLKTEIFNSHENGFDVRLSLNLPQIRVSGARLSLCENKLRNQKRCGSGLKATLSDLRISTTSHPISLSIVLRLRTDGQVARVSVRSVRSNLEGRNAPGLNMNFLSLDIPRIAIIINGVETELDTSKLRDQILRYKTFLGKKLLSFAADFIANDVAEMLNVYLINKEVATSYLVYRKDHRINFNEFLSNRNEFETYRARVDNTAVHRSFVPYRRPEMNPMNALMSELSQLVRYAQVELSLGKISTPGNKDIELSGILNFILNGRRINFRNRFGNSNRALPALNLSSQRNYDINLAISEPLINGALDLANANNLFQSIFETISPVKGFSIRSVKLHFAGSRSLIGVVNAQVDLKQLESKGVGQWFKNKIAAWLERNNNNSVIYFPIEVQVIPTVKTLPGGGAGLDLRVISPFNYTNLPNRFRYPTNVPEMTETVKDGVMEELKTSLEPHTNKTYSIDLSKFLNQSGVVFLPRTLSINQSAYLLMNLDIVDLKFNAQSPNQR